MRTKPCPHRLPKGNTNPGPLETGTKHFGEILCGTSITPQSKGRGKRLRCAPANSPITRGRGVRKPIDRLLRPLALGAWTYATGSPTPKGLGSCLERPATLTCLSGFRHPRTVRIRSTSIIGHTQCLWQFANHGGAPSALRSLCILRYPPQRPVPTARDPKKLENTCRSSPTQ